MPYGCIDPAIYGTKGDIAQHLCSRTLGPCVYGGVRADNVECENVYIVCNLLSVLCTGRVSCNLSYSGNTNVFFGTMEIVLWFMSL